MPIYEFYCADCHTVYSFFSAAVAPGVRPACPRCGRPELVRRPSRFATVRAGSAGDAEPEADSGDPFAGLDDARLERAFEALSTEFEGMAGDSEPEPRQLSRLLRRFTDLTGLEAGPKLRDVLARLDRGEDPETVETELGAGGEEGDEDLAEYFRLKSSLFERRRARPRVDETLYFL
jgi:putative FmdB family regulatory protein